MGWAQMGNKGDVMGSAPWVHRRKHHCNENSLTGERSSARNSLLSWGVCGMSRAGRGSGQQLSLLQPTQSFIPLLRESPLLQGCCYWMNPPSRSWLVSWESLVKIWQSKSLHRCVTAKGFLCCSSSRNCSHFGSAQQDSE